MYIYIDIWYFIYFQRLNAAQQSHHNLVPGCLWFFLLRYKAAGKISESGIPDRL